LRPSAAFEPFSIADTEQSVSERFEQQVQRYPRRLAVKTCNQQVTYDELNRLANRIAWAVLSMRGPAQEPIALLMEKEISCFAAIFGVLKAGGFYVPLSSTYPAARNALLLEDAGAPVIITDRPNMAAATELAALRGAAVINVDELESELEDGNPFVPIEPDDFAYILYTSGTTGRPKGVVESHRNLLHNMLNYTNDHVLSREDRFICLGSCAFSNILKDIYGALLNGAALLPVDIQKEGLAGLGAWIADQEVTIYNSVPTVFRHFLSTLTVDEDLSRIRVVRLGGEPVTRKDVELFRRKMSPECVLVNGYGATETGTATICVIDRETDIVGSVVPVGRPVLGMDVQLLDDAGSVVQDGEVGQIAVRSRYLARGYWRQPELSATVFLDDSLNGHKRMYLTGDMGRRLADGNLVCLGRRDSQVKVRGHRVELAEIELKLLEIPGVKEATVVVRSEIRQENRLVAYVVWESDRTTADSMDRLRQQLRSQLPDYTVPSAFVVLDALPLTPNGKLNPKALPAPSAKASDTSMVPRNDVEAGLVAMWREVLEVDTVGLNDNFFNLGGDSLAATHLFLRIEKTFGRRLPIELLLRAGTVEDLARLITEDAASAAHRLLVPIQSTGTRPPLFVVHGIGGEVLSFEGLARHLGPDQPFFAFQMNSSDSSALSTIESIAARYVDALLDFQPQGPYQLAGYSLGGIVAYGMAQQLLRRGHKVGFLALIDQRRPNFLPGAWRQPQRIARFLRNVPRWLRDDFMQNRPGELFRRLRVRAGALARRILRLFQSGHAPPAPDVTHFFDIARIPAKYLEVLRSNYRALRSYVPQPFPGKMFLFRARSQPLTPGDWHLPDMGWGQLPLGGLTAVEVPGTHCSIMREPGVQELARHLRAALTSVQRVYPLPRGVAACS
jgi:amino acid adenylation domain-containing protein